MPSERDKLRRRLLDIVENCDAAMGFVSGITFETFAAERMIHYAAIRALEIVSEASRHLPDGLRARHPHIDWAAVRDAGNVYRHAYPVVSLDVVWTTVTRDLKPLQEVAASELGRLDRES